MQVTIKLKGLVRIVAFFALITASVAYCAYHFYRYIHYRKILHDIDRKQKSKEQFACTIDLRDTVDKGYILLSPYTRYKQQYYGELVIMDLSGKAVAKKQLNQIVADFRQWKTSGRTRYSYFTVDAAAADAPYSIQKGHIVLLDSALNELKQINRMPYNGLEAGTPNELDGHDFIYFSDDHYITLAYYGKEVDNIPAALLPAPHARVVAPVIQEVDDGRVKWQWDGSAYPGFYMSSQDGNKFYDTAAQDYMHVNGMVMDPRDSNIIISIRNNNQVVKISRKTGAVLWRLGGADSDFPLTREQVFLRQHSISLADSTLTIFDNGEESMRPYSRIVEFTLDENSKAVSSFKAYRLKDGFSSYRGSVQRTGDNYFVCGGYLPYLLLVNPETGEQKLKMTCNQMLYRAYLVKDIPGIQPE